MCRDLDEPSASWEEGVGVMACVWFFSEAMNEDALRPYSGSLTLHSREGGRRSEVKTGYERRARRADAAVEKSSNYGTGLLGAHVEVERGRGVQQRRERWAWQVGGLGPKRLSGGQRRQDRRKRGSSWLGWVGTSETLCGRCRSARQGRTAGQDAARTRTARESVVVVYCERVG
jgi:hypothetical protein